jgi:hypothetical protein
MDRSSAERVFSLMSEISGDMRGRVVSERWWLIWIVVGLETMLTSTVTQVFVWQGEKRLLPYLIAWGIHTALVPLIIAVIHRQSGGQRTATETYIWWIWTTFIFCCLVQILFDHLTGLPMGTFSPAAGMFAAFGFSMMAMITHRFLLICAAAFVIAAIAMAIFTQVQMLIFGASWLIILVALGIYFRVSIRPAQARQL